MKKSALLVVDVQVGVMEGAWESPRIIENVRIAVDGARTAGVPVIWIQHGDEQLVEGTKAWEWVPELVPAESEVVIGKHFNSSFEETNLAEVMAGYGATHVVLAGAATNWCIRATAYGALERGYDLTLVRDAHTTEDMDFGNGKVIPARDIITELNTAMQWVTYPGRHNDALDARELVFNPSRA